MGTRDDILDAAARIMRTDGFARATTKQIARESGYSEAALYKHFSDKTAIFVGVLSERLPGLRDALDDLAARAGEHTVRENLALLGRTALAFYIESFPIAASVFSSQELLAAHRARVHELEAGPLWVRHALARYLRAEQELGRIGQRADPDAAATLLLGACFQEAFFVDFDGQLPAGEELDALADRLARALLDGLA